MKKILLVLMIFLLTGCVNKETRQFISLLEKEGYHCENTSCGLTVGTGENLKFYNYDHSKKVFTKGYKLEENNNLLFTYEYRKDIIWAKYDVSDTTLEAKYDNKNNDYVCDADKGHCNMLYDLITKELIEIDKIFIKADVNKKKI